MDNSILMGIGVGVGFLAILCLILILSGHYCHEGASDVIVTAFDLAKCACISGQKRLIRYMLARGADVHLTTNTGDNALYLTTFGVVNSPVPDVSVLDDLIRAGADPYHCSASGIYPIDSAINAGHIHLADTLAINVNNDHVWEIIDPHTPPRISLGLQSPNRKLKLESSQPFVTPACLRHHEL